MMNKFMKDFIPPILLRLRPKQPMKVYDTFDLALADSDTYEDPGVIDMVSRKTDAYRKAIGEQDRMVTDRQTVQNMFVLAYVCPDRRLDVLEVGGACGAMYFGLYHLLPERINTWRVVETPAMAAAGRLLFQDDRLTFFSDLGTAVSNLTNRNLLIAQGVLQYLKDPLQAVEDFLTLGFEYVYITRTVVGVGIERSVITKQVINLSGHGPSPDSRFSLQGNWCNRKTSQPLTVVPFESLTACVSSGYHVVFSFAEGEANPILLQSRTVTTRMIGFLLEKIG
jgi:putative methyltransferase (TIGR04325 family)